MPTTKQLYGREGTIVINGVKFSPKMRHFARCDACSRGFSEEEFRSGKVIYSRTKRADDVYLCPLCFKKYYGGGSS